MPTTAVWRWRRRLLTATAHAAWRGQRPWLQGGAAAWGLSTLRPTLTLQTRGGQRLHWVRARWAYGVLLPLVGAPLWLNAGGASLWNGGGSWAHITRLWSSVLRGLGGLCRVKLRYKGKSFKWHRRRGALMLRFGHAHLVALVAFPGVRWRKVGRMKILLFGSNVWDLLAFGQAVCWWRPMNVYHGRGLRLRRQLVLRKAGKVSAYR